MTVAYNLASNMTTGCHVIKEKRYEILSEWWERCKNGVTVRQKDVLVHLVSLAPNYRGRSSSPGRRRKFKFSYVLRSQITIFFPYTDQ